MKTLKTIITISAFVAVSALSMAQGGGRGGFGGMMRMGQDASGVMLIQRKDVQKDLAITADQKTKLEAYQQAQQDAMRARMEEMRNGGGGGFDPEAMRATFTKMQEENKAKIAAILTKEQMERLKQINIQMMGARAALVPELAKELGITDDQKASIDKLQETANQANASLMEKMRSGEIDREEFGPRMQKNNDALTAEIEKALTDAQKAKLKEMGGKKFDRDPKEQTGFGGRGGGGGGI
jgi:Spy/CpxP family protein refolding chaperone